ncbi:lactonase family protein [Costertonia aggregata]|uniref:Lactonase family protein n=1 Tax=Costertonia aggregata TaxID=343403 RepID=A0A7H9AT12_9FLAO|nr:lactonase family protein [Costertonia aggregata]QLG46335.1 lactonase family protein [Costertonia aggregata]
MKSVLSLLFFVFMTLSCKRQQKESAVEDIAIEKSEVSRNFYVGTYTDDESEGIYQYALHKDGTLEKIGLSIPSEDPSFLTFSADKRFLLAVSEIDDDGNGKVSSFQVKSDTLILINQKNSGGAHPCHITVNDSGNILVSNYTSGTVGLLHMDDSGLLTGPYFIQKHTGKGTTQRQKVPHAHSSWFVPDSDSKVISIDLGTNQLWFSHLNSKMRTLTPSEPTTMDLPKGAGPRHLSFHPNGKWLYVVNELNSTVSVIEKTKKAYRPIESYSTLPKGFKGESYCADIHISSDGKFLYASNRGDNSIVIYKINAVNGGLTVLGHESVHGEWPRNFSLSPDESHLLVANQYSNNIVSFKRDKKTGLLNYISEVEAPSPVCILF